MNTFNLIYLIVATSLISISAILLRNIKEKTRLAILKYTSIAALAVHLSLIWVTLFSTQSGHGIENLYSTLWPVFPCNLVMVLLPITFSLKKTIKPLYPFVITLAIFGGLTTLIFPDFNTIGPLYWGTIRSYLSHTILLFVGVYALVSKEYKPKPKDIINVVIGCLGALAWGYLTIFLFKHFAQRPVNAMFIKSPAIQNTFLNAYGLILVYLSSYIIFNLTYYYISLKKQQKSNKNNQQIK